MARVALVHGIALGNKPSRLEFMPPLSEVCVCPDCAPARPPMVEDER